MDANLKTPETLQAAIEFFANPDNCHAYMVQMRWPDGIVTCPICNKPEPRYLAKQRRFECRSKHPRRQFSVKVGTIFEDSPIALKSWLLAVWQIVNCKNGISSYELARALGVTQKTAWFMNHRILQFPIEQSAEEPLTYGPFWQEGHLDGTVILIGGKSDPGSVKVQNANGDVHVCKARRDVAKQLREYLYEGPVRVMGRGKWLRTADGQWRLVQFDINGVTPLEDESLSATIARLRAIDAPWKDRSDPLAEIDGIRRDG